MSEKRNEDGRNTNHKVVISLLVDVIEELRERSDGGLKVCEKMVL